MYWHLDYNVDISLSLPFPVKDRLRECSVNRNQKFSCIQNNDEVPHFVNYCGVNLFLKLFLN